MKNISIKWKILTFIIIAVTAVSIVAMSISVYNLKALGNQEVELYKKEAYIAKKDELKNYIKVVTKTVESYHKRTSKEMLKAEVKDKLQTQAKFLLNVLNGFYNKNKNTLSNNEMQKELLEIVKNSKYGKSGYFWINDKHPTMIMHPIKPALDGRDLTNVKDPNGKALFVEFVKAVNRGNGEGFVDYMWSKPGFSKPQDKISYVFVFEPFDWIIGTGEYIDNITENLQKEALATISQMRYAKDNSGYFWINDSKPSMVMHPIKPALNGKNLASVKDPNGKALFVEFVKAIKNSDRGGFVDYMWSKPGFDKPQPKISYVYHFKDWDWIIGTGVYVNDIEEKIAQIEEMTLNEIKSTVLTFVIINSVVILITLALIFTFTSRTIIEPLDNFLKGLDSFFKFLNKETTSVELIKVDGQDEIGKIATKINDNIECSKNLLEQNHRLINDVKSVFNDIKHGDLSHRVNENSSDESLMELKNLINDVLIYLNSAISNNINDVTKVLNEFGKYNFVPTINSQNGQIAKNADELGEMITKMLITNKENAYTLLNGAQELTKNVEHLNSSANHQAASLEETSASIEQIMSNIEQTVDKARVMAQNADEAKKSANIGKELAHSTSVAMDEIQSQTKRINESIEAIDQIAFQTNILSLNAAVEAATAGESGKGFAVVAGEVRNLAGRSAEAAKEIKNIVESATTKTDEGKDISDKMLNEFIHLNDKISETSTLVSDVAGASSEQMNGVQQISNSINELDKLSQENAKIASMANDIAAQTSKIAHNIVEDTEQKEFRGK
jgi:methyl-accepting chemotaxis protein